MLHPAAAYRRFAQQWPSVHPLAALRRPALAAIVAGAAISLTATGRVTAPLLLGTTLYWSFAFAWQVAVAAIMTRRADTPLTMSQRLDLLFTGQAPWSLWLLIATAWIRLMPGLSDLYVVLCTTAVPAAWTSAVIYGFYTGALGLTQRGAIVRTLLHQASIWLFAFVYVAWAVALWARASAAFAP
jgi:hypothetical protein